MSLSSLSETTMASLSSSPSRSSRSSLSFCPGPLPHPKVPQDLPKKALHLLHRPPQLGTYLHYTDNASDTSLSVVALKMPPPLVILSGATRSCPTLTPRSPASASCPLLLEGTTHPVIPRPLSPTSPPLPPAADRPDQIGRTTPAMAMDATTSDATVHVCKPFSPMIEEKILRTDLVKLTWSRGSFILRQVSNVGSTSSRCSALSSTLCSLSLLPPKL